MNSFNLDLLIVMGVLAGLSALLFLMAALDPTNEQRPVPARQTDLDSAGAPQKS